MLVQDDEEDDEEAEEDDEQAEEQEDEEQDADAEGEDDVDNEVVEELPSAPAGTTWDVIDDEELKVARTKTFDYLGLVQLPNQDTKTARSGIQAAIDWTLTGIPRGEHVDMNYMLHNGRKVCGMISQRYYSIMRLLNRAITWYGALALEADRALGAIPRPWGKRNRPDKIGMSDDPWTFRRVVTWQTNVLAAIRKAALVYVEKSNEDDAFNPILHIWAVMYYFVPTDFTASENRAIGNYLPVDPTRTYLLRLAVCPTHMDL